MSKILLIGRSSISISPYIIGEARTLERRLSIYDYKTHEVIMRLFLYDDEKKTLFVPKGITINYLLNILAVDDIYDCRVIDKTDEIISINKKVNIEIKPGIAPKNEHQINSVSFLLQNPKEQKFLNIDTGYGKTFCSVKATSLIQKPVMIVVSKTTLMEQWKNRILEYTNCTIDDISMIQGRPSFINPNENATFYICSTQTVAIMAEEKILQDFVERCQIGIKIIDEAHEMLKSTTMIDLVSNVEYNFYLTATPMRSDTNEDMLYNRITKGFKKFGSYTNTLMKYTHVRNLYIDSYPSGWMKRRSKTKNGFSNIIYETLLFKYCKKTVDYIYAISKHFSMKMIEKDPDAKILIAFSLNESIEKIKSMFEADDIECGVYTSKIDKELKQEQLNKNIILTTIKSSGSGLDVSNLRMIINFVPFKSQVLLHQLFGRLRYIEGKAVFYFNIVDEGYNDIKKQNYYRQKFFEEKAADIKNIKFYSSKKFTTEYNPEDEEENDDEEDEFDEYLS